MAVYEIKMRRCKVKMRRYKMKMRKCKVKMAVYEIKRTKRIVRPRLHPASEGNRPLKVLEL
ncbi:MAG: hypothetical protein COS14_00665 [Bacteroidetes bacterium CG02_land_8_20_14_3_00_31_25]|nr:MAG: hypothetical protein COS14_00665 [Bacteroidetes bacterium CG02_land_8_20_14_3_00_31_25]